MADIHGTITSNGYFSDQVSVDIKYTTRRGYYNNGDVIYNKRSSQAWSKFSVTVKTRGYTYWYGYPIYLTKLSVGWKNRISGSVLIKKNGLNKYDKGVSYHSGWIKTDTDLNRIDGIKLIVTGGSGHSYSTGVTRIPIEATEKPRPTANIVNINPSIDTVKIKCNSNDSTALYYRINSGNWIYIKNNKEIELKKLTPNTKYNLAAYAVNGDIKSPVVYRDFKTQDFVKFKSFSDINLSYSKINFTQEVRNIENNYSVCKLKIGENYSKIINNKTTNITLEKDIIMYYYREYYNQKIPIILTTYTNSGNEYTDVKYAYVKTDGNIPTVRIKKDNKIKEGMIYIKKNGELKQGIIYMKKNGKIKRGY